MEDIEMFKQKHFDTYKNAVIETIKNNTNVLIDGDLSSLIKKPPLDSMDLIKNKFLSLAKKYKIILDLEKLDVLLDDYRKHLNKPLKEIKKNRIDELTQVINEQDISSVSIKLLKKDFNNLNKNIKSTIKNTINDSNEKLINKINTIFINDTDNDIQDKIKNEINKYIGGSYQKQLIENIDIKILIKDTTLINLIKEQTDRYLFTLENSYLFKE